MRRLEAESDSSTRTAIIALTASGNVDDSEAKAAGCDALIHRPAPEEALFETMEREVSPSGPPESEANLESAVAALPKDVVVPLRGSLTAGDDLAALAVLRGLPDDSPGRRLIDVVQQYRFDELLVALEERAK